MLAVWIDCVLYLLKERREWTLLEDCLNPAKWQVLNPVEGWEVLYEQGLDLEWDWEFL